ncbi:MAG TPA: alkaline phosphatase family protein [Bryobacteraceae bacterium]|jgi:predicted AlkP superfamily pyrophosphatase or phosphodiesterase|nr:alkaline phosphatase family protein [Bryobacteraceae bacterium]
MRRILLFILCLFSAIGALNAQPGPRREFERPKLVLGIVIDQFRFDYLNRFRNEYTGAFAKFFERGAVFTNAHEEHFPTVTAIGHSTFLTGATPSISGIVNNQWYDRTTGKTVTSVSDEGVKLLGAPGPGSSPRRLLASTVGDEMKMAGKNCKVIGISIKDRSAILPAGHMADGAYWFDPAAGVWVSSSFYFPDLPGWVKDYNARRPADQYANAEWKALDSQTIFARMPAAGPELYSKLEATPFGNELIEQFAERAVDAEQIGKHPDTDLLTVSFSSNDYVGHALGPDAPEVRDITLRTDRLLDKFLQFLDSRVGLQNVLIVLTADHGVAPIPEVNQKRRMPGGRLKQSAMVEAINSALTAKYGEGKWIVAVAERVPYLNFDLIKQKNLQPADVERTAADAVRAMPDIFRVYTREQLMYGLVPQDRVSERVLRGYYPPRAGDIIIIPDAYWIYEARGASHGTPFNYDTHVPVIFMGANIRPGRYDAQVAVNDIAPTLAAMLEIEIPSGSVGRVLSEMFAK